MLMYEAFMHLLLYRNLTELELETSTRERLAVLRNPKTNSQQSLATTHEEFENDPA